MGTMKRVSIRELRYDFKSVERVLREGDEIQVTKRGKVIARLSTEPIDRPPLPDFLGNMRERFGDRVLTITGAQIISEDRDG